MPGGDGLKKGAKGKGAVSVLVLLGTIAASSSRGMIEYEVKDDENYPMGIRGTLFFSLSWIKSGGTSGDASLATFASSAPKVGAV